PVKG
ncbi:hypothetical protein D030_5483B, partial [Vibrio parahaemolyticus AQ3810]